MYFPQRNRGSKRNSAKGLNTINVGLPYGLIGASLQGVEKGQRPGSQHEQPQQSFSQQGHSRNRVLTPTDRDSKERPLSSDRYSGPFLQDSLPNPEGLPPAPRRVQSLHSGSPSGKVIPYNLVSHKSHNDPLQQQDNAVGGNFGSLVNYGGGVSDVSSAHSKHRRHHTENQMLLPSHQQQTSQVFLPGDRVIFTESPSAPGIPIVYRIADEKQANPDKLNLDRRNLTICPVLEGEDNLRLLNYQHNLIQRIQHVSNLRKLIFLDLYDNKIQEISGLSSLKSLRVLMLGKNRIKKINNLNELTKLDVLDLHGNKIAKIDNLSHLCELRVLNLAGNELVSVQNITGLHSLAELNLRRNKICTVMEVNNLQCLQRIFLSYNEIKRFDDINSLAGSASLTEVSLDGNPFALHSQYKQTVLQNIKNIRQLDMKRISDEEKRIASVMAKKEEEKRKESDRAASLKEKRRLAILNAQRQWELQHGGGKDQSSTCNDSSTDNETASLNRSQSRSSMQSDASSSKLSFDNTDYSVCHLAELDGEELNLYGPGALDAIDRNWGERTSGGVTTVKFHFISFDDIVPYLPKVRLKFPMCQKLYFIRTDLSHFGQVNSLAALNNLDALHVSEEGNPITLFTLWKAYTIFRLSHLSLQSINDSQIGTEDMVHAEKLFGSLGHITMSQLSQSRLMTLLGNKRKLEGVDLSEKNPVKKSEGKDARTSSGEPVSRAGLTYWPASDSKEDKDATRRKFSKNYIHELLQMASLSDRKRSALEKIWPKVFHDMVSRAVQDMANLDSYMKQSLDKIKTS